MQSNILTVKHYKASEKSIQSMQCSVNSKVKQLLEFTTGTQSFSHSHLTQTCAGHFHLSLFSFIITLYHTLQLIPL